MIVPLVVLAGLVGLLLPRAIDRLLGRPDVHQYLWSIDQRTLDHFHMLQGNCTMLALRCDRLEREFQKLQHDAGCHSVGKVGAGPVFLFRPASVCLGSTVVGHDKVAEVLALAARGKAEYLEKVSSITDEESRNLFGAYTWKTW